MVDVVRTIIFLYQSNNIEAHVKWQIVMADIGIGGIDDTPALSPRYRFFGTHILDRRTGLDLDDNQNSVLVGHDIELVLAVTPVHIAHHVPPGNEILGGTFFAALAGVVMQCHVYRNNPQQK